MPSGEYGSSICVSKLETRGVVVQKLCYLKITASAEKTEPATNEYAKQSDNVVPTDAINEDEIWTLRKRRHIDWLGSLESSDGSVKKLNIGGAGVL